MFRHLLGHFVDIIEELFKQEEIWFLLFVILLGGALVVALPGGILIRVLVLLLPFLLFLIIFPAFRSIWLFWRQELYKKIHFKTVLLELIIPRELQKSSQSMEQVLAALHSLRNLPSNFGEKYFDGEVTRWFSLEIVSFGGEVHFYVRIYHKQRNLVESAFFSYYPDIEIVEVDDYVDKFPASVPEMYGRGMDLWGSEMVLAREDLYPIKTYPAFERQEKEEEKLIDPISTFLEVLSKLKEEEVVGIQILIAPTGNEWVNKWDGMLNRLKEPKTQKGTKTGAEGQVESFAKFIARSPGETEILEAVENNLSKSAFETLIRFIYLSPKSIFYDSFARRGLAGAFNQYSALNLNFFRQNWPISTRALIWNWPHLFPKWRNEYRKQRVLYNFIRREMPPETRLGRLVLAYLMNWNFASRRFVMNIEGLATLFHPPTSIVLTEPHIKHLESRRKGPPSGLAIFGEEGEIEKFR
ncbi:MAG: hypothetical protein KJI72_01065 [Patescibacteria group bacterium]|nr:hypothetical protein [Patescibacteria group bacterium]